MLMGLKHALSEAPEQVVISSHCGGLPLGKKRKKKEKKSYFVNSWTPLLPLKLQVLCFSLPFLSPGKSISKWFAPPKVCASSVWRWAKMPAEKRARKASDFLSLIVSPEMLPVTWKGGCAKELIKLTLELRRCVKHRLSLPLTLSAVSVVMGITYRS